MLSFRMRCGAIAVVSMAMLAAARTTAAQRVTGVVRDSATREPLNSVIVSLLANGDRVLGRGLTNNGGAFGIMVLPGTTALQLRRIGYRPVTVPVPSAPNSGAAPLELTMARLPTELPRVVSTPSRCPRSKFVDQANAAWEEARTGFLAAIVARNTLPARVRMYRYVRRGNALDRSVTRLDGETIGTFSASRSPAELARLGYAESKDGAVVFFGPVADALLDESFRETHCFDIAVTDGAHRGQLGIRFTPMPGRDSVIEVSGVVWMHRTPLALGSVEFHYEGLGRRASKTGGDIGFRSADNGAVVIDRWSVRLNEGIALRREPPPGGAVTPDLIVSGRINDLRFSEEGGELREAIWPDGTRIDRPLATVTGRVVDPDGKPLDRLRVMVPSTPYSTVTDATGHFRIDDVVRGSFRVAAFDTLWPAPRVPPQALMSEINITEFREYPLALRFPEKPAPIQCTHDPFGPTPTVVQVQVARGSVRAAAQLDLRMTPFGRGQSVNATVSTSGSGKATLCGFDFGTVVITATDKDQHHAMRALTLWTTALQYVPLTLPR
jgi:hypothetical protein